MREQSLLLTIACLLIATAIGCGEDTSAMEVLTEEEAQQIEAAANLPQGLELGEFEIREIQAIEGKKSTVTFQLFANIRAADFENATQALESRRHALRDQVITATRVAALEEFDEPDLSKLRRRILSRLRRALPGLVIREILITNFRFSMEAV